MGAARGWQMLRQHLCRELRDPNHIVQLMYVPGMLHLANAKYVELSKRRLFYLRVLFLSCKRLMGISCMILQTICILKPYFKLYEPSFSLQNIVAEQLAQQVECIVYV